MSDETAALFQSKLELLERQCKRLRREAWLWRFGTIVALGAVGALVWSMNRTPSLPSEVQFATVRTRDFSLVDGSGLDRARLRVTPEGLTMFTMNSTAGKGRVMLASTEDGGGLFLMDKSDSVRLLVGVTPDGPKVELLTAANKQTALLTTNPKGGFLALANTSGTQQVFAGLSDNEKAEAGFGLRDIRGRNRANLGLDANERLQLSLRDSATEMSLLAGWNFETDKGPTILLLDESGEIRGALGLVRQPTTGRLVPVLRFNDEKGTAVFSKP